MQNRASATLSFPTHSQSNTNGNRIHIFGFSRGTYTARTLAGMVHNVGLLPACNHQQVLLPYKMFTRIDAFGWRQSEFKRCIDVDIEFIGVWDTVDSVGLGVPRCLPFTASNTTVRTFHRALSLDDHRDKFKANLWHRLRGYPRLRFASRTACTQAQAPREHAERL
ncbi:hypothetical protein K439DRAFT_1415418 [Ramaria rubella]|nr:hypothetical protein K439DRAFT_1415418 [Ramaria rubella]